MLVVKEGNGESNVLRGQAGQDNLIGGGGADIMYGGTDSDHYYVDNAGDVVREYVGEGTFDVVWTNTSYPSHLGWLQFKPVRPASRAMPKSKRR
jgi:Ca2+-binding RTX toxin-like protein